MLRVKDIKKRDLIVVKGSDVALARYEDMSLEDKEDLASLYVELTGKDYDETMDFLNFDSEEKFCS